MKTMLGEIKVSEIPKPKVKHVRKDVKGETKDLMICEDAVNATWLCVDGSRPLWRDLLHPSFVYMSRGLYVTYNVHTNRGCVWLARIGGCGGSLMARSGIPGPT